MSNYKCHFCPVCEGFGCINELPGMGGVFDNANFIQNCAAWKNYHPKNDGFDSLPQLRLAPITGAVENVGFDDEETFYFKLIEASLAAGFLLSIGDGCPDVKIKGGIAALQQYRAKGAVFIKPYPNNKIFERIDWARNEAEYIGIDIDSYNILTMRKLVQLEKKDADSLHAIRKYAKLPFAIKGIFTDEDIELIKKLKPDVAVVSNHGGRIETARGSTADFLAAHRTMLQKYAGEVWVDGGIRTKADLAAAKSLGASQVMIARPCITALLHNGIEGMRELYHTLTA